MGASIDAPMAREAALGSNLAPPARFRAPRCLLIRASHMPQALRPDPGSAAAWLVEVNP